MPTHSQPGSQHRGSKDEKSAKDIKSAPEKSTLTGHGHEAPTGSNKHASRESGSTKKPPTH